jgi:hypothetical protein
VIQPALGNGDTKGHVHEVVKWPATVHARRIAMRLRQTQSAWRRCVSARAGAIAAAANDRDIQLDGAGETAAIKSPE